MASLLCSSEIGEYSWDITSSQTHHFMCFLTLIPLECRRLIRMQVRGGVLMPHLELILIGIGSSIEFFDWQRIFKIFRSIPRSNWTLVGRSIIGQISGGQ